MNCTRCHSTRSRKPTALAHDLSFVVELVDNPPRHHAPSATWDPPPPTGKHPIGSAKLPLGPASRALPPSPARAEAGALANLVAATTRDSCWPAPWDPRDAGVRPSAGAAIDLEGRRATGPRARRPRQRRGPLEACMVQLDFGCERREGAACETVSAPRYGEVANDVSDVNEVDALVSRPCTSEAQHLEVCTMPRGSWARGIRRGGAQPTIACPSLPGRTGSLRDPPRPRRRRQAAMGRSLIASLTFPAVPQPRFRSFMSYVVSASGHGPERPHRSHVNDVKLQQPRGATTSAAHERLIRSRPTRPRRLLSGFG